MTTSYELPGSSDATQRTKSSPPPWFFPLVVGVLAFGFVWEGQSPPGVYADFDYLWAGGYAVWHGREPYVFIQELAAEKASVAPDTPRLRSPFYYPATAAVLMAPFGALSRRLAASLFAALGMTLLCWSVDGWRRWIVISAPAFQAIIYGQWSPYLTAAIALPWLGFVWAAKPTIGTTLFAGWPSRWALYGGLGLVLLSLVLLPHWPLDWIKALRGAPHYSAPVQRFGGFLLLLAFFRWRRPEARMLGLLALVPHTTAFYEQLPLLLIPQNKRSLAVLMGLSYLAAFCTNFVVDYEGVPRVQQLMVQGMLERQWPYFLVLVYLPALYLVLQPRSPNAPGEHLSRGLPYSDQPDSQLGTRARHG